MTDCKTCSKCGEVKAASEFRSGRGRACKKCTATQTAAWRKANPEKMTAIRAAYRKENHEKLAEKWAAYYKKNTEKSAARSTAWRKANPEKAAAKTAAWRKRNPEKSAAAEKIWRKANHEKVTARNAARVLEMRPAYVADAIGIPASHLTPELLALKREQLTLSRAINQLKKEMKNVD